jgi:hypothetical protein
VPITGQAANNLTVACGGIPDPFRPFYGAATITQLQNASSSTYNAFQVSARKTAGPLQFTLAYTWSHSIDDSSDRYDADFVNTYDPAANRASSGFDIRQMLNVGWVYDLPFFRTSGLAHKILGGWQYSGIFTALTGTPYTPTNTANYSDNAGVGGGGGGNGAGSYPDRIGDPQTGIPNVPLTGFGPLNSNPLAFAAPQGLTFGTAGRNSLRNPGYGISTWLFTRTLPSRKACTLSFEPKRSTSSITPNGVRLAALAKVALPAMVSRRTQIPWAVTEDRTIPPAIRAVSAHRAFFTSGSPILLESCNWG